MKGELTFGEAKNNVSTYLDKENGLFYLCVDLNSDPVISSKGNEMAAKGFFNMSYNERRIFGNLNLNIGKNKAQIKAELAEKDELTRQQTEYIAELEAKLAKK